MVGTQVPVGAADSPADEFEDPRPTAELVRQWSTFHPEFTFLPRKFKIAVTGSPNDRAVVYFHDIGLRMVRGPEGTPGYEVIVGGGQGRTPMIGKVVRDFLPREDLLAYLEAVMRVYNLYGRRDNKYKARVKILVHELGLEAFRAEVEAEFARQPRESHGLADAELTRIESYFRPKAYKSQPDRSEHFEAARRSDPGFADWVGQNLFPHKVAGYAAATITVKRVGGEPGDVTARDMRTLADLADRYSFGEMRITHEQNVVLADVRTDDLHDLYLKLAEAGLADANKGLITDIIACPGLDYCALATARSIPIAQDISHKFENPDLQREIGPLSIKISGCINACGHHHVGHIGILGLEKAGEEFYQITLGGDATETAALGERAGPGFASGEVADAIGRVVDHYLEIRDDGESFLQTCRRVGPQAFKDALYATH